MGWDVTSLAGAAVVGLLSWPGATERALADVSVTLTPTGPIIEEEVRVAVEHGHEVGPVGLAHAARALPRARARRPYVAGRVEDAQDFIHSGQMDESASRRRVQPVSDLRRAPVVVIRELDDLPAHDFTVDSIGSCVQPRRLHRLVVFASEGEEACASSRRARASPRHTNDDILRLESALMHSRTLLFDG
eukprot:CAMPEP_0119261816 /NCGR_PEP_ID=MMETSP1329-20130426/1739_1 /TAXON_ID=114041 /ORGANISM="Genus nov. species nov., Strain RCC1024" /LENGTH=189 /DNA_ID=CAMNT_0007261403 /DNA_START=24 /DNA_END=595 /DNA_ORIENTATION=+